jgi:hypothetical protein
MIDTRLAGGPVDLTWTAETVSSPSPTGGLISSFSSYGLSPDLSLKPDIGAPGGSIRSTYPIELGSYANISGTSMSSPHVAGGVALLLQAHPWLPASAVRDILQNSADPAPWWGNPALGFLDNVNRQGAGMLDIDDAILATTLVTPGKLAVGESQSGTAFATLRVDNFGSTDVTYDVWHEPALAVVGTFAPSFWTAFATVILTDTIVTVPAGGSATVEAGIYPPSGPDHAQYGGYIVFSPQGGGQTYRVPYAGFVGDYQSIQAIAPTVYGFPWLSQVVGGFFENRPDGGTFTLVGDDLPYILLHLDHQVYQLRLEVFDAHTGKAWHRILLEHYLPRNSSSTSFFAFPWDGTTTKGNKVVTVPDGDYVIRVAIIKALGSNTNPADWETWVSPTITIDRP